MTWVWRAYGILVWYFIRLLEANKQTTNKLNRVRVLMRYFTVKQKKSVLNFVLFPKFRYDLLRLILLIVLILGSSYWAISFFFNCIIYKSTVVDLIFFSFSFSCFHQEKNKAKQNKNPALGQASTL